MQIFYATQTGTAFDLALTFRNQYTKLINQFEDILRFESFSPDVLYVFFIATTGEGDPPQSMKKLWKKIMTKSYPQLKGVQFCIYGLGDRSYGDHFNLAARKFRQRLLMLEAEQVVEIGLGDDQDQKGYQQIYDEQWSPKLQAYLQEKNIISHMKEFPSTLELKLELRKSIEDKHQKFYIQQWQQMSNAPGHHVYWVKVRANTQQAIMTGDTLNIYPQNSRELVQKVYKYLLEEELNDLGWNQGKLLNYLSCIGNLHNAVNRSFFTQHPQHPPLFSHISTNISPELRTLFKQKLQQLAIDYSQYFNYIKRYRRNVLEVITDFSLEIPLSCLVGRLGIIFPRKYSIAKVDHAQSTIFYLLVKQEQYEVNANRICKGLCSSDLISSPKEKLRFGCILKNGELQYESSENNVLILLSLGVGIAPFLNILYEAARPDPQKAWNIMLFHSARTTSQTYLDPALVENLSQKNKLILYQSITREKLTKLPNLKNNMFYSTNRIQHVFAEHSEEVVNHLHLSQNYKIMICGPKQIKQQIQRIIKQHLMLDIKKLKKSKKLTYESW